VPQNLFTPLEDFMNSEPALHEDQFFAPVWRMIAYDGHVWAVPTTTDTTCLLWNKTEFRKAGLDPERPPQTFEELMEYTVKLTIKGANGSIDQMGFLPWLPWDQAHMWGCLFGGDWFDFTKDRAVCGNDPAIIASLRWQQSFTLDPNAASNPPYAMDPEKVQAFVKGIGDYMSVNNPFYLGKVAMITEGEWQVTFIPKYAPGLEWGVAPIPQPAGARPATYCPSCNAEAIPSTARHKDAAKKYLRWFYNPRPDGRPAPVSDYNFAIHNIPVRMKEAREDRFMNDPKFRVFVDELFRNQHVDTQPMIPVSQYMLDEIERVREKVAFREMSPEQAARDVEDTANRELTRMRALMHRGQTP
jgi:multiple sugar transport system substrate-binding protein